MWVRKSVCVGERVSVYVRESVGEKECMCG